MFRKASNMVMVALVAVFLMFPIAANATHGAGIEFPEWLGVGKTSSPVEGRTYTIAPNPDADTIAKGEFQTLYEKHLSDIMPMRDGVILTNAAIQRTIIELANSPKGYDCYPTYFGSTKLYTPRLEALTYLPIRQSKMTIDNTCTTIGSIRQLAADYPETKFVICFVQGGQYAAVNPGYKYVRNATTGNQIAQSFMTAVGRDIGNLAAITTAYETEEAYFAEFFRTDHHWNSQGAVSAFNKMADITRTQRLDNPTRTDFPNDTLFGSIARWGLCLHDEPIFDLGGAGYGLMITEPNGTEKPYSHSAWLDNTTATRKFKFHDQYYEFVKPGSVIVNSDSSATGNALLICDSYGADFVPILGTRYKTLTFVKDLHSGAKTDTNTKLRNILEQKDYDAVYIVAGCQNFINISKRSPHYFD